MPVLIDTVYREECASRLRPLPDSVVARLPRLAFARGVLSARADNSRDAVRWLTLAQVTLGGVDQRFVARVALELGHLYLRRDEPSAADAVLAWAEGVLSDAARKAPDVLLLRALRAKAAGNWPEVIPLCRAAIAEAGHALTPHSHLLALQNLAIALEHSDPHQSLAVAELALALAEAEMLDPTVSRAVRNIMGYAAACCGDLARAADLLAGVERDATEAGNDRVAMSAAFNRAIVDELAGRLPEAKLRLEDVTARATRAGLVDLVGWSAVRRSWIALVSRDAVASRAISDEMHVSAIHAEARQTLEALHRLADGDWDAAIERFDGLRAMYAARDDQLTAWVHGLWTVRAQLARGREDRARDALAAAERHGSARFTVSPNWWSQELVNAVARLDPERASRLVPVPATPPIAGRALRPCNAPSITIRQRQVLALVAEGKENKEIAYALGISNQAVKFHLAALLRRMNASNRAALVRVAVELGELHVTRTAAATATAPISP
jgi:DNA-binding CsgD family transcriptional regulator